MQLMLSICKEENKNAADIRKDFSVRFTTYCRFCTLDSVTNVKLRPDLLEVSIHERRSLLSCKSSNKDLLNHLHRWMIRLNMVVQQTEFSIR